MEKNRFKCKIILAFFVTINSTLCFSQILSKDSKDLKLEFSQPFKNSKNEWRVASNLKNTGPNLIVLKKHWLPWASRWSIDVVGVTISGVPKMLQQVNYIDDPMREDINLEPGKSLEGEINFNKFFFNLTDEVDKNSIGVCYSYLMERIIEDSNRKYEGCYVLSQ